MFVPGRVPFPSLPPLLHVWRLLRVRRPSKQRVASQGLLSLRFVVVPYGWSDVPSSPGCPVRTPTRDTLARGGGLNTDQLGSRGITKASRKRCRELR